MSENSPSSRKKVRLDVEAESVDVDVPLEQDDKQQYLENEAGPSVLQAARLAKIIQHRPKIGLQTSKLVLAWSSNNLIAIARSKLGNGGGLIMQFKISE